MDEDYVVLMNQKNDLKAIEKSCSQISEKNEEIINKQIEAQNRLDALFKMKGFDKPALKPRTHELLSKNEECKATMDYEQLFEESLLKLKGQGINPCEITREDFLDIETLKRIDVDANIPLYKQPHLDKHDYMISACSGIISGLIDSFFVGKPGLKPDDKGLLQGWTDKQADKIVNAFALSVRKSDNKAYQKALEAANKLTDENTRKSALELAKKLKPAKIKEGNIASAIGFLEDRFKINYDARYSSDLVDGDVLKMSPSNHHFVSLAHSPDIVGLFFSVLDQFTGANSFISDGKIIRLDPAKTPLGFKLTGGTFVAKLYCGICNWLGHIVSDMAGSSGTRGHINGGRGSGVPIPFFELFLLCDFGSFKEGNETKKLAEAMITVFEKGYDLRFAGTMAIPVLINELILRLSWTIKSKYYHKRSWGDSIPVGDKPDLQRMILIGQGCLCLFDLGDAAIRSGGNTVELLLHLNLVAWVRFSFAGYGQIKKAYNEYGLLDTKVINKTIKDEWDQIYQEVVDGSEGEKIKGRIGL